MALQMDITLETGINLPESYIRVTDVMLSYGQHRGWVTLSYYANKIARTEGKNPVKVEEYRVFDENGVAQKEAVYNVSVADIVSGSASTLNIDFTGDGVNDVAIVEGTDFTVGVDKPATVQAIADALNLKSTFNAEFTASVDLDILVISAKATGVHAGTKGNSVAVSGDAVTSVSQSITGVDYVPSDFQKYFSISDMSMVDVNIISQAYTFIKSMDKFGTALSV